ncbi:CsbD family protein [Rhodococcus sp. NPDC059234]|uniref:CsbD family protein n=1 Tax=Rhodococcus sp. NPDC059234 TaxID=3346781 RepID=UPI00366CB56E
MGAVDKAKNKAEELAGSAKEKIGKATGDTDTEAEGQKDRAKGNLKQAGEKVKDVFKD